MMDGCVPTFRQCAETATVFESRGPRTTMEPILLLPRNWSHACDWRQRNSWPCSQLDGRGNRQRYSCGVTVQVDVIFEFWDFETGVSARSGLNWTEFLEESEMILKELWFDVTGSSDAPFLDQRPNTYADAIKYWKISRQSKLSDRRVQSSSASKWSYSNYWVV